MSGLSEYRVTFGQQYPREPHPWSLAHRDGWLSIIVPDDGRADHVARALTVGLLGRQWSDLYAVGSLTEDEWTEWFPRGELARITYTETNRSES